MSSMSISLLVLKDPCSRKVDEGHLHGLNFLMVGHYSETRFCGLRKVRQWFGNAEPRVASSLLSSNLP
jgi:hypothetical protein